MWVTCGSWTRALASHNDGHKYLLNAIDAFSKYAYSVPIRFETSENVASDIGSISDRTRGGRTLVVRKGQGKSFCARQDPQAIRQ